MAKDDYNVVVFKILTYYYGLMKRRYNFSTEAFEAAISKKDIHDEYFIDILWNMANDGLLKGMTFVKAWEGTYILTSDIEYASITPAGIKCLMENSTMKRMAEHFKESTELISSLIKTVL